MTYQQIYTAVENIRFDAALLTVAGGIKDWIRAREAEVWQYADWPLEDGAVLNLAVVNGVATIALPTGLSFQAQELEIFDENGFALEFMAPRRFYERYQPYNVPSITPGYGEAWTLTTDLSGAPAATPQVRIGPIPNGSRTYTVRGWSLPISRSAAAVYKIGAMSADSDLPWWPDDFHYFLVDGAIATGKRQRNDPTWQADEGFFQNGLERLAETMIPLERIGLPRQWGGC